MNLKEIVREIKSYEGIKRKKPIGTVIKMLREVLADCKTYGDDAAIINMKGNEFSLFAIDGIWSKVIDSNPRLAGHAAIMVGVNDILAMGGKSIGIAWTLGYTNIKIRNEIVKGLKENSKLYGVPIVGGHLHPNSSHNEITTAILGRVKKKNLITSFGAHTGDRIIIAIDLAGQVSSYSGGWNSDIMKNKKQIYGRMNAIWELADGHLANACKDISNPGIIGSLGMMLERNGLGALVEIKEIPKPLHIEWKKWVNMFPCYGFILAVANRNVRKCIDIFVKAGIDASVVGEFTNDKILALKDRNKSRTVFDFKKETICGINSRILV
ncbi:MAG: AIR synthase related protein [Candidatus Bathyarchaeota archaeon]